MQLICGFSRMLLQLTRRTLLALKDTFIVRLTAEQRHAVEGLAATGKRSAAVLTQARLLRQAAAAADGGTDDRRAAARDASPATVARVRQQVVARGREAAVQRQRPTGPQGGAERGRGDGRLAVHHGRCTGDAQAALPVN